MPDYGYGTYRWYMEPPTTTTTAYRHYTNWTTVNTVKKTLEQRREELRDVISLIQLPPHMDRLSGIEVIQHLPCLNELMRHFVYWAIKLMVRHRTFYRPEQHKKISLDFVDIRKGVDDSFIVNTYIYNNAVELIHDIRTPYIQLDNTLGEISLINEVHAIELTKEDIEMYNKRVNFWVQINVGAGRRRL